jgi:hypothetical protein
MNYLYLDEVKNNYDKIKNLKDMLVIYGESVRNFWTGIVDENKYDIKLFDIKTK